MPTSNSAKKRLRQNIVRRSRNRSTKTLLKSQARKVSEAVSAGNIEEATLALRAASKHLDKAAAKGVLHSNAAARAKSRLSAVIKAAKAAPKKKV